MARQKGKEPPSEVTLPITPMLDMSFQLLFFFISTFKLPTGMEGSMDLNLPSEATKAADKLENVDPKATSSTDPTVDLQSEITISVQTQAQGADADGISNITVEETAGKTPVPPPYSKDLHELTDKLAEIHQTADPKQSVKIQGDAGLKWRGVIKVMDACRKAGFDNISFAQPPDYSNYTH
jgi:biopolymer transport protein ExbD